MIFKDYLDKSICPSIDHLSLIDKNGKVLENTQTLKDGLSVENILKIDYKDIIILQYEKSRERTLDEEFVYKEKVEADENAY